MGLLNLVAGPIIDGINNIIDKFVPDAGDKLKAKTEVQLETLRIVSEQEGAFEKRVLAEIQKPNWLRDSVRPVITYFSFGLYAFIKSITVYFYSLVYFPILQELTSGTTQQIWDNLKQVQTILKDFSSAIFTEWDFWLLLTVFTFWFGGKLLERAKQAGIVGVKEKSGFLSQLVGKVWGNSGEEK